MLFQQFGCKNKGKLCQIVVHPRKKKQKKAILSTLREINFQHKTALLFCQILRSIMGNLVLVLDPLIGHP